MKFADKLTKLIADRETSQSKLSRKTGIAQTAISDMCNGKRRAYMDQSLALARALGVSLDFLADDDLDAEPKEGMLTEDEKMVLRIFRSQGLTAEEAVERLIIKQLGMRPR